VLAIERSCAVYRGTLPFGTVPSVPALFTSSTKVPGTHSFPATSTLTYILLPTGARGTFAHCFLTFVQRVQTLVSDIGTALFMFL
jgi:hypothetical protein